MVYAKKSDLSAPPDLYGSIIVAAAKMERLFRKVCEVTAFVK
jgi:hypothetical protein